MGKVVLEEALLFVHWHRKNRTHREDRVAAGLRVVARDDPPWWAYTPVCAGRERENMVKRERVHGGCLGATVRRRPW